MSIDVERINIPETVWNHRYMKTKLKSKVQKVSNLNI